MKKNKLTRESNEVKVFEKKFDRFFFDFKYGGESWSRENFKNHILEMKKIDYGYSCANNKSHFRTEEGFDILICENFFKYRILKLKNSQDLKLLIKDLISIFGRLNYKQYIYTEDLVLNAWNPKTGMVAFLDFNLRFILIDSEKLPINSYVDYSHNDVNDINLEIIRLRRHI